MNRIPPHIHIPTCGPGRPLGPRLAHPRSHIRARCLRRCSARALGLGVAGLVASLLLSLLMCAPASAATTTATFHAVQATGSHPLAVGPTLLAVNDLPTVVNNATKWLVGILATLATFFLTLGGAKYMAAGGDPSQVEQAKSAFRSAAIGYALAVLAPVILTILKSILGVG
jgi:hypothetical protein